MQYYIVRWRGAPQVTRGGQFVRYISGYEDGYSYLGWNAAPHPSIGRPAHLAIPFDNVEEALFATDQHVKEYEAHDTYEIVLMPDNTVVRTETWP